MPVRHLPSRPDLAQLKRQSYELQQLHREGRQAAAARIIANHPRYRLATPASVLATPLTLADAQLVLAREYGFQSWAALKYDVEAWSRVSKYTPHPRFDDAVAAIRMGDLPRLSDLLSQYPELTHARTNLDPSFGYFTGATLLHHIAWNPSQSTPVPSNIVEIARLLLDRGAEVNALTLGRSSGTTMGLIATSKQASDAGVSGPLMELLLERGATLDLADSASVIPDWGRQNPLHVALSNHAKDAAEKMITLGAKPDLCTAAALGRMDWLRGFFDDQGHLRTRARRGGELISERDAIGLAALFAFVNERREAFEFLFAKDGNWNMTGVNNGALLHRAAWDGDLALVQRLVAKGADVGNRDNPFGGTPLSWAQHNKQVAVFDWLRTHCEIDLHDAVGFDLRDHVAARLREDPSSVNLRRDHWDVPLSTPLYWASWTHIHDVDGRHDLDEGHRLGLVRLLLESGADPNIVSGDGNTPLDVAVAGGAKQIAKLLSAHGGRRGEEL